MSTKLEGKYYFSENHKFAMPITDLFTCAVKYFKNLGEDAEDTERKPTGRQE